MPASPLPRTCKSGCEAAARPEPFAPHRRRVEALYPGSRHLQHFGLDRADDEVIWQPATREGFAIVTKDADFHFRSLTRGHPPKLIYLCMGNCPTRTIVDLLLNNVELVRAFLVDPEESFIMF